MSLLPFLLTSRPSFCMSFPSFFVFFLSASSHFFCISIFLSFSLSVVLSFSLRFPLSFISSCRSFPFSTPNFLYQPAEQITRINV
jgi:hypothetical protein